MCHLFLFTMSQSVEDGGAGFDHDVVELEEPIRLPSSTRINLSVRPSVHPSVRACLQIRYSAENGTGPTDSVNYSLKS